ncbi:MAG: PKD domain-containing protein [Bacteroidales bacterium]|nr:PKD domain-containing protein [Bacteroidales bacterium]
MAGALTGFFSACGDDVTYLFKENNPPEAGFEVVVSNMEVAFTNTTTSATSFFWEFGDGTVSDEVTPENKLYLADGIYDVTLTVTDDNEKESVYTMAVSVPYLSFNVTDVDWGTVTFNNNDVNADSWLWNFGDGNTSTDENPVHEYMFEGKYTVTCVATAGSTTNTYVEEIETEGAAFQNPLFDGDRGLWSMDGSSTYSGSGSPTPIEGTGAKYGKDTQYLYQTVKVFPNQLYRVSFYAAIDDKGIEGYSAPLAIYAGEGIDGVKLVDENLAADVNSNTYTLRSFDFVSDDSGFITFHATYGDVTVRICTIDISPIL